MKYDKLIGFAWKEITRCKARSILNMIGYFLAIMVFSIIITLLFYSEQALNNVLSNTGTHFISFKPQCCGLPYLPGKKQNFIANGIPAQPLPVSMLAEIKKIAEVKEASPYLLYKIYDDNNEKSLNIGGFEIESATTVGNTACASTDLISGRFLNKSDSSSVLLEESYAVSNGYYAGQKIKVGGIELTVAGIVNPGIRPAKADIYMLINTAEKIIGRQLNAPVKEIMNIVLVESANAHLHYKAMTEVSRLMGKESLISTYSCFKPASGAMNINKRLLGLLFIIIFLLVLVIAFKNQYSSLLERRHDLGVLSAIGWSNKMIILMVLLESIMQITIGALTAFILFSILIAFLPIGSMLEANAILNIRTVANIFSLGCLTVAAAGLSAAIVPTWWSIKVDPAVNLRVLY
jgi:putative ABC transport system permease protein